MIKVRLYQSAESPRNGAFNEDFEDIFERRKLEADMFYDEVLFDCQIILFLESARFIHVHLVKTESDR